jgi:hypothetical protein
MAPTDTVDRIIDPIEALNAAVDGAWYSVCRAYDVSACLPAMQILFGGVDLSQPSQAAEAALAAMLLEAMESVGRFSPWYKKPARAFGLVSSRDRRTGRARWLLAPEAVQKWQDALTPLAGVVRKYSGLIQAMLLVDDLMQDIPGDPCITARCACQPPHAIHIRRSVLVKAEILCGECGQAYH